MAGQVDLAPGAVIIAIAPIAMLRQSEMTFGRVRSQPTNSLDGGVGQRQSRGSVFEITKINLIMRMGELVIGQDEIRIARNRLLQQVHGFIEILARLIENGAFDQKLSARVKIVSGQIGGGFFRSEERRV